VLLCYTSSKKTFRFSFRVIFYKPIRAEIQCVSNSLIVSYRSCNEVECSGLMIRTTTKWRLDDESESRYTVNETKGCYGDY